MPKQRKWTEKNLINAASKSTSVRQVISKLGLVEAGGNYEQIKKYLKFYKIDTKHFTGVGWSKGLRRIGKPILSLESILTINNYYQSFHLKNRLYNAGIKDKKCEECGWAKMSEDGRIPLELDHINGDRHDNRLENLRILCPNCHSLKTTHRGLNRTKRSSGEIGKHATLKML